ncbi:hypothetical protein F4808DRAFT_464042 [Astrocystis sublimbata]|nr:hypothetical protein F4808DRAFT_464042 [Astrocystis sublimbata]
MSQIASFKVHTPKAVTRQKCQCQCQNPVPGKLALCRDAVVGKLDPEMVLCDVCYFEIKEVNHIRRAPLCQYPPNIRTKIRKSSANKKAPIPSTHKNTTLQLIHSNTFLSEPTINNQPSTLKNTSYRTSTNIDQVTMCKIYFTYACDCKEPQTITKNCGKKNCENVDRIHEPPCDACVKDEMRRQDAIMDRRL